jgi:hypothetical protein
MSKPWVGFLAAGLLFLSGVLEYAGGHPKLGIFLMILSFVSLGLRIYINKKAVDRNKNSGL